MKEIDYEEMLLQVSDVMRAHNKVIPIMTHEKAAILIRRAVTPTGEWIAAGDKENPYAVCSVCGSKGDFIYTFCPFCGVKTQEFADGDIAFFTLKREARKRLGEES